MSPAYITFSLPVTSKPSGNFVRSPFRPHILIKIRQRFNMLSTQAVIPFIEDKPLYDTEKLYTVVPLAGSGVDPASNITLCRLEVTVLDIRDQGFTVAENGVEVVQHSSNHLVLEDLTAVAAYSRKRFNR